MSKLTRYLLVTAALYGPFSYAADPVVVNQSDRKTMYGTAAVRPTPDAFDLASRGMCYVATDTGTVTEWTGTAWITTATCPGSATTSTNNSAGQYADDADFTDGTSVGVLSQGVAESASPTAVTEGDVGAAAITLNRAWKSSLYTPLGDSAMDDTADAVVTKSYITDNSQESDALDVDSAACTTTCPANYSLTVGTYGWAYVQCTIKNVGDGGGGTPTLDAMKIWLQSKDEDLDADTPPVLGGSTGVDADDFVAPVFPIIWARSGTAGTVDATPDMPNLDEGDSYVFQIDVRGAKTLKIGLSASADNTSVNIDCNGW